MNRLKQTPLPIPPHTRMQVLRNTCNTRACSREIVQYKYTKCAYTSVYVHPHARVYECICIYIHRHTYIHIHTYTHASIHAYMHTHIHTHAYAHVCKDRKSQQQRLNVSSYIIDTQRIHMHMHAYTHIYTYTHTCKLAASVFADVCVGVKTHLCNIHTCPCTSAHNTCTVHVTLTAKKCTYIYTHTHTYMHTYVHVNTCAYMTPSTS